MVSQLASLVLKRLSPALKAKDTQQMEVKPPPAPEIIRGDPHARYRFLRVVGQGHYGTTFLCTHLETGEQVAIKALDKHHPEFDRALAVDELRILAAISDHPNVATLIEAWEDGNFVFLVLEACMGGELFDQILERKHLTEHDTGRILLAIMSVLHHCHERGIIHRDLKPENFLLHRSADQAAHPLAPENLRAIDFGLSKLLAPGETCHSCVGSSYYVAPEVLKGEYSFEADVWSVGVIAYILLSGFPPFWGSSDHTIFQRILENDVDFDYEPWHLISPAAKDFVGRLLTKDPAKRMSLVEAMQHPWITEQASVSDAPMSTAIFERLQKFTMQNRVKCMLMTLAARHLSDDDIGSLREIFSLVDADHDGVIDMQDLSTALELTGIDVQQEGIRTLLDGLDLAHAGRVHAEEFIAAALDEKKVLTAKAVNGIFAQLDDDKDGFLTLEELSHALRECHIDIVPERLAGLMDREGALEKSKPGMISAKSFQCLLLPDSSDVQPVELETFLQDAHQFSAANHFKQLAMLVIARHMEPEEVEGLRRLFQRLDVEATGTINAAQLQEGLACLGKTVGEQELQELVEALDLKHHGVIEYDEFLAAALEEQQLVTEARLRAAFNFLDRDGDGAITAGELAQAMSELGMEPADANRVLETATMGRAGGSEDGQQELMVMLDDFRRLVINRPPSILTKPASREWAAANRTPRSIAAAIAAAEADYWLASPRSGGSRGASPRASSIPSPVISLTRRSSQPSSPVISLARRSSLPLSPHLTGASVRCASTSQEGGTGAPASPGVRPSSPGLRISLRPSSSPMQQQGRGAEGGGGAGLTLFQVLKEFSSSGYASPRRQSLDLDRLPFAQAPASAASTPPAAASRSLSDGGADGGQEGQAAFGSHMNLAALGSAGEAASAAAPPPWPGPGEAPTDVGAPGAAGWLSSVMGDEPFDWRRPGAVARESLESWGVTGQYYD